MLILSEYGASYRDVKTFLLFLNCCCCCCCCCSYYCFYYYYYYYYYSCYQHLISILYRYFYY